MKKGLAIVFLAFALVLSMPMSLAFATVSPDTMSPDTQSPDTQSPDTQSPDTQSPDTQSPDTQSPDTQSPDASMPQFVNSPQASNSNVEANSINHPVGVNASSDVSSEGILLSPKSGAPNLALIAIGTVVLFAIAGGAAWLLRKKLQ